MTYSSKIETAYQNYDQYTDKMLVKYGLFYDTEASPGEKANLTRLFNLIFKAARAEGLSPARVIADLRTRKSERVYTVSF